MMTTCLLRGLPRLSSLGLLAVLLAMPDPAAAQQPWPGEAQPAQRTRPRAAQPDVSEDDQLSPRQMQTAPSAQGQTQQSPARRPRPAPADAASTGTTAAPRAQQGGPRAINCSGVFGKDSTHLKLAIAFDSRNLVYTEVEGPDNTKLNASVIFPNDPKRRLEVLWQNEGSRTDTSLIVINGQSQWTGPKGLKLGMPLAALEKANGKPFKLAGLDQANAGTVVDWNNGALTSLPGGCSVGVRLMLDPKTPDTARAAASGVEVMSSDPSLKGVKMSIAEILIGYPQQ